MTKHHRKPSSYRVLTLSELIKSGHDPVTIFEQIDSVFYMLSNPQVDGNDYGSDEKWNRLMLDLPSCVFCLFYGDILVGYWSLFAVTQKLYDFGIKGRNINASIDDLDVEEIAIPGDYLGYFVDLFVLKEHRNLSTNPMLFDSFKNFLKHLGRNGIYFQKIFTNASSPEAIRLCTRTGFRRVADHSTHVMRNSDGNLVPTKIYEVNLSEADCQIFDLDRELKKIYSTHFQDNGRNLPLQPRESAENMIRAGESERVEFKSTLRTNLQTNQHDEKIELAVLKTIAGFLNAQGGALLIGVGDEGQVLGLSADGFASEDKMGLHLGNLIKARIGDVFLPFVHPQFEDQDGKRILIVRCDKGTRAAFVKDGNLQHFYVRGGNSTPELSGSSVIDYVRQRFE